MSKPRQVMGLKKVELRDKGPFTDKPKLKGRAAEGIRHQNKVHAELETLRQFGRVYNNPWLRFRDTYGYHWCQPDSVVVAHDRTLVVEAKLSLRRLDEALAQLNKLYRPTLEMLFGYPVVMLVAFRHWLGEAELELVDHPREMLQEPLHQLKQPFGWHLL